MEIKNLTAILAGILAGALLAGLVSCIPEIPDQTIEVVNECYLPEPYPKPKLTTVKYVKIGESGCVYERCMTYENVQNAIKREVELILYANNMTDLYNDARDRCNPQGE